MIAARAILFLVEAVFGVVEFFIGLRIILKLLGANVQAPFVAWVYETSQPLIAPFDGMFGNTRLTGGFVIEFSAVFGLLVYGLVAYAVSELVHFVSYQTRVYHEEVVVETRGRRGRK